MQTAAGVAAATGLPTLANAARPPKRDEVLRVGLVGCGGRGNGAAVQALTADANTEIVAMGDAFEDRIDRAIAGMEETEVMDRVKVDPAKRFIGFDAYKKVIDSGIDVVILATSPHFRPLHMEYALEKGVHMFVEKPVATDAPGLRRVMEVCRKAKAKNLSVVSGLCYRYEDGRRALMEKIHGGAMGNIVSMEANYVTNGLWLRPTTDDMSSMEKQMRNWLYHTWLSGDHIAEQHIHSLDVMAWAMQDAYPVKCFGIGGRQTRTGDEYGNVYDHFTTVYTWANGVRGYAHCRQQVGCYREVEDTIVGTQGVAKVFKKTIFTDPTESNTAWKFEGKARNMYQAEHDEMFAAIRAGQPLHNGDYMCKSTLMAIMARMAAYTGEEITFEQALNSTEDLSPTAYTMDTEPPTRPVAMPGKTKFV